MTLRKLCEDDVIPFKHGLEPLKLDCNWAWVAEKDKQIVGLFLAAPCHGSVMLIRLVAGEGAPIHWAKALLSKAASDMIADGYQIAFVYLNLSRPLEQRLAKLMMNVGKPEHRAMVAGNNALCAIGLEDWT